MGAREEQCKRSHQVNFNSVSASNTTDAFISTVLKKALTAELKRNILCNHLVIYWYMQPSFLVNKATVLLSKVTAPNSTSAKGPQSF